MLEAISLPQQASYTEKKQRKENSWLRKQAPLIVYSKLAYKGHVPQILDQ